MGKEIERKFLVASNEYKNLGEKTLIRQGYICAAEDKIVRIRVFGEKGFITVKGATCGFSRDEWEYKIPISDAMEMLDNLAQKPIIEKYRWIVDIDGAKWEVDEFLGDNQGLIVAEIELESEETNITLPNWIGAEVTGDSRYYNAELFKNPYKNW